MALDTNLVAFWNLDESSGNAVDNSGNGHDLTNVNTVTYTTGLIGNCADFGTANTNKRLQQTTSDMGWNGNTAASMSMWLKVRSEPGSGNLYALNVWAHNGGAVLNVQYSNLTGTKGLRFTRATTTQQLGTYDVTLGTANWHHLVLTYDGTGTGDAIGYLDGSQVLTFNSTSTGDSGTGDGVGVGDTIGGGAPSSVYIDMVGAWTKVLSPTEVTQLYNGGAGLQYPFTSPQNSNFLMYMD